MEAADNGRGEAIRYWEKRRIVWNLILVPPSLFSYWFASYWSSFGNSLETGDPPAFGLPVVAAMFCFAAVGANILYSFAYVIEFWIQGALAEGGYQKHGRNVLFILGCFIGVGLALATGDTIARSQYPVSPAG